MATDLKYSGMRGIVLACEKALEKHHNPGIFGRIKSYFNIRKLKEKIKDMDNEVNAIHQRFMVIFPREF